MRNFKPVINRYSKRLTEIKEHIKFISIQKELFNEINNNNNMNKYSDALEKVLNSTVQYNSIIICLYGCFEEFIDEITLEYLNAINNLCKSYNDLPEAIRKKHLYKVGEFLSNPQRYKGYELTIKDCINNIYNSINSCEGRKLNTELIISHSANLNINKVCNLYNDLGITHLLNKLENKIDKQKLNLLDELVNQRNTIAHSWEVDQRYAYEIIEKDFTELLMDLGKELESILTDNLYTFMYDKDYFNSFDNALKVIRNRILCINSMDSYLEKGDFIFCKNGKNEIKRLEIVNIQHNNKEIDKITEENIDVGIEVNDNIRPNWTYYYLKEKVISLEI